MIAIGFSGMDNGIGRRDSAGSATDTTLADRPGWRVLVRPLGGPLLVAPLIFGAQLPFFNLWFNFMDEGHMVQFADMVLRGGEFYRDATFYPLPGAFYFLVLIFKIFGPSIVIARWVVMIEFAIFVMLVFVFMRRIVSLPYAALSVACMLLYRIWCFPHWHIYSYSTTSLLVLFICVLLLIRFFESADRRVLGLAGFVFGLGVLCKQDYGAAALLAVLGALVVYSRSAPRAARPPLPRLLVWFFLPASLVGAVAGLHYWRVGILDDLLRFTVFNHLVGMSSYKYMSFPDLFPVLGQDIALRTQSALMAFRPGILFMTDWVNVRSHPLFTDTAFYDGLMKTYIFGPQLLLAAGAVRLWLRRAALANEIASATRQRYLQELVLLFLGTALICLVWLNKPQDYVHLAVLYWPLICLALIYLHDLFRGRRVLRLVVITALILPISALAGYSGRLLRQFYEMHSELLPGERAGIYVQPKEVEMLTGVVSYMRENSAPGERVGTLPYFPIVNFLAERDGPHRSAYVLWPFPELPDRDQRIIDAMEATGTDLVIYNFTQFFRFPPVWEYSPSLFRHLVENFEIDRVFSHDPWGYKLVGLKRVDPGLQRPGIGIIGQAGERVSLSVAGDGPPRPVAPEIRSTYLQRMLWPFRPVLALRPSTGGRRSVMSIPLRVPDEGGRIRSAVAVHPQWWFELPPSWVRFKLAVRSEGERAEIFSQQLSPTLELGDRRWFDVDVSLDAWAGREVTLEFINETERTRGETVWMGGWAEPRLLPSGGAVAELGG